MLTVRKNDTVVVISGKDKGKQGKVLKIFPKKRVAIVEGINFYKRHTKANPSRNVKGGILEKEGFIISRRDKRYRRFYPVGVEVPEEDGIKLSKTQENILDFVERHPKSTQKDMTREIKESQQTISYNINVLVREGFLKEEKIKGTKRYEIFEENT